MTSFRDPVWSDATNSEIALTVHYDGGATEPFFAFKNAPGLAGDVFTRAIAGEFGAIGAFVPASPTTDDVTVERDRRIEGGFMFSGKLYDSRPDDQTNIAGAAQMAFMAIVAGAQAGNLRWTGGSTDFGWIAHDNTVTPMDAQTVVAFGKAAADWKSAHIFAGRTLKNMATIPADYTADSYWPALA